MDPVQYLDEDNFELPGDADACGFTKPGWYFWDETWASCHGPYDTRDEANAQLQKYCHEALGV